ncbi:MAG: hypothetical protein U5K00_02595 [Melioribacteraceae bacterium]|nr:hypothetical protein [Melioribacteraceae bacterium]
MKKVLLIFGAAGSLGSGVVKSMKQTSYDKIYLFDKENIKIDDDKMTFIKTGDLSNEKNVENTFSQIELESDAQYFLFSTIGGFAGGNSVCRNQFG